MKRYKFSLGGMEEADFVTFPFPPTINVKDSDTVFVNSRQKVELIPVPVNQDIDLEFCFACQTVKDVFWNGKINICVSCDKGKGVARKMKIPLVDEGIPLEEFFSRLLIRAEVYGEN